MTRLALVRLTLSALAWGAEWSEPASVLHEFKPCVTYRAAVFKDWLIVEASLAPGWHTFVMDNERRAAEKLAGKPSLGIDQPTQITADSGLEITGAWRQSEPKDFSKPQIRWYSWGYQDRALFAAPVRLPGGQPVRLRIRGQACTDTTCKNVDVTLTAPVSVQSPLAAAGIDPSRLIPVRP
jgi:hypothetical protein